MERNKSKTSFAMARCCSDAGEPKSLLGTLQSIYNVIIHLPFQSCLPHNPWYVFGKYLILFF